MSPFYRSLDSVFRLLATLVILLFLGEVSTVHAQERTPTFPDQSTKAQQSTSSQAVIDALDLSESQVASIDFVGSDQTGYTTFSEVASNFPQEGDSFAALSSGCAGDALNPDDGGSYSCNLEGITGPGEATDMVRMELELNIPSDASTVQFNLKYLSEEFPEFVGSAFNDAFVVEMGESTFTVENNDLIAPDNLVFDNSGNPITINTTGETGMTEGGSVGTTYDGGTSVLTTTIQLPSDQSSVKLIFSIFDVGDEIYDSSIFIDNFRFQESQDLELVGLEANQSIQDWQNSVPLIEDKRTTVRSFIQSKTSSSSPAGKVRLQGFRNGNPLPGSPISPSNGGSFQAPPQTSNATTIRDRRADMNKSLNFNMPSSWQSGTVDLKLTGGTVDCSPAAATNDACEFQVSFTEVPQPKVKFIRIKWTDSGGTTHIPSQSQVQEHAKRTISAFPIPSMNWGTVQFDWDTYSSLTSAPSKPTLVSVNSALQGLWALTNAANNSSTIFFGSMVNTGESGRAAGIPANVASADLVDGNPNTTPHELAHVLNQQHSVNQGDNGLDSSGNWKLGYCGPNPAYANTSAPEYPFTNAAQDIAALGPTGQGLDNEMWGVDSRTNQAVDPRDHGDLMSYCSSLYRWPSSWRYDKIRTDMDGVEDRFGPSAAIANTQQETYKLIRGTIDLTENTAEFVSTIDVESSASNIENITPPAGDYTLRLLDANEEVVDEIAFEPALNYGPGTPETALFLVPVLENAAVEEVRLLGPDSGAQPNQKSGHLASITASPNPPTTTVDFPNGGESLDGETATFKWSSSDADNDDLSHTVEYSPDGGTTWTTLTVDWPKEEFQVDLSELGQTEEGLLRVRAGDGFSSASDNSDGTFSVPNSSPEPFINSPGDGSSVDSTSAIPLEGDVNDVEDDQFSDTDLTWTSSIDGDLGTGATLNVGGDLSVGTHTITFSATDSDGATGETSIELNVLQPGAETGGETPVASEELLVDSDGSHTFGGTGVKVNFVNVSGSANVLVEKFDSAPAGGSEIAEENVSQFRYVIDGGGLDFGSNTEVRFMLSTVGGAGDDLTEGDVVIYSRPEEGTGSFSKLSTTLDDKGDDDPSNDELYATVSSFSEFVLASDSEPLPVEMADFKATTIKEDQVRLTWQTVSETNNAGFEIQRKTDEQDSWTEVNFVKSKAEDGTTTESHTYRFEDAKLPYAADELRYRLRQVDVDGSTSLSDQVTIQRTVEEVELLGTFPNPTRGRATVRFAVPKRQETTLALYDVLGRRVRTLVNGKREGRQEMQINVSDLSSGVYFLRLQAERQIQTQRMTVVR